MENPTHLLNLAADNIRTLAVSMVERAKSGHPGGAMGGADFINVLFSEFLTFDPERPTWECRDRFFLDPGHMSPMLYAQLALIGRYSIEELMSFRQWGSATPGHPEVNFERGIENTSGPLGQGHTFAVGAAIAAKALYARTGNKGFQKERIYSYISDGGVQEEISQGAGRLAGHLGLDNLIMFFDANEIQLSTPTADVISEDTAMKYRAWNWNVLEIDGNDPEQILFIRHLIDRSRLQSNVERFVNLVRRFLLVSCCHLIKQSCHFCRILSDACAHVLFRFCHTSVYHFLRECLCYSHIVVCSVTVSTVGDLLDGVVLVDLRITRVSHFGIFFIHEGEGVVLLPSHHRVSRTILRSLVSTVPLFCEVR